MNEYLEFLKQRRSIRHYKGEQISDEQLAALQEMAVLSASSRNSQPWHFLIIQKKEILDHLEELTGLGHPLDGGPTLIVSFGREDATAPVVDSTLAMSNIMNAAVAVGLGTCYMWSIYYLFHDHPEMAAEYGVPEGYICTGAMVVGIPDETPKTPVNRKTDCFTVIR